MRAVKRRLRDTSICASVMRPSFTACGRALYSVPQLTGVAGVLVSDEAQLIITSNRADNTIGIFPPGPDPEVVKVPVGVRPNGLAYDHGRRQILVANVGDPATSGSHTLTVVALDERGVRAHIPVSGRTRWAIFDPDAQAFYVNIADPPEIVVVDARKPADIARAVLFALDQPPHVQMAQMYILPVNRW